MSKYTSRLTATSFDKGLSEFEATRELVRDHFCEQLEHALSGDAESFRERLIAVLADLHADLLVASVRSDAASGVFSPTLAEAATLLPALRLQEGISAFEPSLGPTLVGRGWHQAEPRDEGLFSRWSGPNSLSSIFLPRLMSGSYVVNGELRFLVADARETFRLRLGDADFERPRLSMVKPDIWFFEMNVPVVDDGRSTFSRLEFFCEKLARPVDGDPNSRDTRTLGFSLHALNMRKV